MDTEQKRKFLAGGWKSRPISNLLSLILAGEVTIQELLGSIESRDDKNRARVEQLKKLLQNKETEFWTKASNEQSVEACILYLGVFGEGSKHYEDVLEIIRNKEEEVWQHVLDNPSLEAIEEYQRLFPEGKYYDLSIEMADDLPWYITLKLNTISDYIKYREEHPGEHDQEIEERIELIYDENDWKTACKNGSIEAYQEYLRKHPHGKYAADAKQRIINRDGKDLLLDELREDINAYPVLSDDQIEGLRDKVKNNVASWEDLEAVFTKEQIEAIQSYEKPDQLPLVKDFEKLPRGYAEVYFWGTRGTGKTCAIGATIGYLTHVRKSLVPLPCPGQRYLLQLQLLFNNDGHICSLPPGTINGNLPAMAFSFQDKEDAEHRTMLIDVAGEVFAGIFKAENGIDVAKDEQDAIDHLKQCLNDDYNNKIHFFIIEYGQDDLLNIDGYGKVAKSQIMQSLVSYFAKEKLFRRSSVSMNILVTKCDRIKDGDRRTKVQEYIETSNWAHVVNGINNISVTAKCGVMNVFNFSIGKVFAQDLCVFCPDDAEKIVSEIESKTHPYQDNWFSKLIEALRN